MIMIWPPKSPDGGLWRQLIYGKNLNNSKLHKPPLRGGLEGLYEQDLR